MKRGSKQDMHAPKIGIVMKITFYFWGVTMTEHINTEEVVEQLKKIEARWVGVNRDTITDAIDLIDQKDWKIKRLNKLLSDISHITKSRVIQTMIKLRTDD